MKRKWYTVVLICMVFALFCNLFCIAEGTLGAEYLVDTAEEHVDHQETEEVFSSKNEWRRHLNKKNKEHRNEDLEHERIQDVLKQKGVAGLNKYQYKQLLSEEQAENFLSDELLICFIEGQHQFKKMANNNLFKSMELVADLFYQCKLKRSYSSEELLALIGMLAEDTNVDLIQPNFIYEYTNCMTEADYTYSLTQAMEQVNATAAWNYYQGDGVIVGMIDTGVELRSGQTLHANNMNEEGFMCTITNCLGHGTAVSTVIGGNCDYAGVAPKCVIYCRHSENKGHTHSINADGSLGNIQTTSNVAADTQQLIEDGCRIINLSLAQNESDVGTSGDMILNVIQSYSNTLFVQSAGNNGRNLDNTGYVYYDTPNYICVSSVDRDDNFDTDTNYGVNTVHIAAPGVHLSLPSRQGDYYYWSGTSFAAPFVSGTAALLLQANSSLTATQLKNIILSAADMVPGLEGKIQGGRRLNVMAAVEAVNPPNGERYGYLSTNGVLRAKDNQSNGWVTIASNVQDATFTPGKIFYRLNNNYLYVRAGNLSNTSVAVDTTGTVRTYAASWNNLMVYDGATLKQYLYNESTGRYVQKKSYNSVKCYGISGNRLTLCYTSAPKVYHLIENMNASGTTSNSYQQDRVVTDLWLSGSRIHVYQEENFYAHYDSWGHTAGNNGEWLSAPMGIRWTFTKTDFSFDTSMTQYRWCYSSGINLYIYGFENTGRRKTTPETVISPDGVSITALKCVNYRVYFFCGNRLYGFEGDSSSALHWIAGSASTYSVCGDNIGIIDISDSNSFKIKSGEMNAQWVTLASNVAAIYVSY